MKYTATVLLALAVFAGAQTTIPDTRPGAAFRAWLDAFNSGDRARIVSYYDRYQPTQKDRIDSLMGFHDQTGGFNLIRIEKSEPLHLEALVKERDGSNFGLLKLDINDVDPPTVKQIGVRIVPPPADQPKTARLTFPKAVTALDRKVAELAAQDKFSGAVIVARGDAVSLEKAYGSADRSKHVSNTVDTRFRIGSMNKMFTATAILQLVSEGKVDLEASVGRYLPEYPNHEIASKVTIRQLLTHTGGTGDIFTPEYEKHRLEIRELTDYVKLFGARGPEFEPGSKWAYSNYGFILLGVVIEKVSGVPYYDFVRKHVFEPAGMRATDSQPESDAVPKRSLGYMRKDGAWVTNTDTLPWRATSAGGGYSTVGDLFRFAQALCGGKLIKLDLLAQMTSKQVSDPQMPASTSYGFGMMISDEPQGKRFGHGGGAPGMNGELRIYPRTGTIVVVLANLDPPTATRVADFFDESMPED